MKNDTDEKKDQVVKESNGQKENRQTAHGKSSDSEDKPQIVKDAQQPAEEQKEETVSKDKYLRALADYHNLSKRIDREREEIREFAGWEILQKLLPIVDDIERAAKTIQEKGFEIIYKKFSNILEEEGLERIKIKEHEPFDPERMECIEAEDGGNKLIEIRAGYIMKGKVVRPAHVKVVK